MNECPLCGHQPPDRSLNSSDNRLFHLCGRCFLLHADPCHHPDSESEKKRYLSHNNGIEHQGYVDFLNRSIVPALQFLKQGMHGLDYGCGPAPTLSALLEERGMPCDNYDPFFFPHLLPGRKYDFIFSTECFEHFFYPGREIPKLLALAKAGGHLIIMTDLWKNPEEFASWSYGRDFTHVSFYHAGTLNWISKHYGIPKVYDDGVRVAIFRC